jgi:hypothetical protein
MEVQAFAKYSDSCRSSFLGHRHETTATCSEKHYTEIEFHQTPLYPASPIIDLCFSTNIESQSVFNTSRPEIVERQDRRKKCQKPQSLGVFPLTILT